VPPLTTRKEPQKREIKQERAVRTREEIMEVAIRLFARRGFLATTMSELAKAIRMTPGALYWHFPTKEDLLLATMDELHQRYVKEFIDLFSEEGRKLPARKQLVQFLQRTQSFLRYHREYGIFYGMVAAESADANARVAEAARNMMGLYAQVLAGIIKYGQNKTGEFRSDVDPSLVSHAMMASYMGMFTYQNLFRDSLQYDPLVSAFDRFLTDGLEKRGEAKP
jgi:TetR/AcrR family transcriptional regulator, transcriptional repressor for nem operon